MKFSDKELQWLECIGLRSPAEANEVSVPQTFIDTLSRYDARDLLLMNLALTSLLNRMERNLDLAYAAQFFFGGKNEAFSDDSWSDHKSWILLLGVDGYKLACSDPDLFYSRFGEVDSFPECYFVEGLQVVIPRLLNNRGLVDSEIDEGDVFFQDSYCYPEIGKLNEMFPLIAAKLEKHDINGFEDPKFLNNRK